MTQLKCFEQKDQKYFPEYSEFAKLHQIVSSNSTKIIKVEVRSEILHRGQ